MNQNTINKKIEVPILARVEGEGALEISIKNNKIAKLNLKIYEPPRFFEKFLEGREPNEVIDAVARICGICPVAYQMSGVVAIEQIFNIKPTPWLRQMRRLFYCGEWIESHALHIHLLAAPDFFNCSSILELAKKYPDVAKRGMKLHALGVDLMSLLGQRSVNPVGACVGGFYKAPENHDVQAMLHRLNDALSDAKDLVLWTANIPLPQHPQKDFLYVSMVHPNEYPMNEGQIKVSDGNIIDIEDYEKHFQETQIGHSTALHSHYHGSDYLVGPLARLNHNFDILPDEVKMHIEQTNIKIPSLNMFHSMFARSIEIYYAIKEAIRILQLYNQPMNSIQDYQPKAGIGYGCTEAPRGILWKKFSFDKDGLLSFSKIVPPTSQNQARIESELKTALENFGLDKTNEQIRHYSEMIIRNYDPCISCSTHFLKLKIDYL